MVLDFLFTSAQWFELIKTLATGIVAVYIGYRFALQSKSKEIRLASYYKERIEAVRILYGLIAGLEDAHDSLLSTDSSAWTHVRYKSALADWLTSFEQVYQHYNKNRILLIEKSALSDAIRSKLNELTFLRLIVRSEQLGLLKLEEDYERDDLYNSYYENLVNENEQVHLQVTKLREATNKLFKNSIFDVIRNDLEAYFRRLTS